MSKLEARQIEALRREFQNVAARTRALEEPQGCPDAERIWEAAAGELPVEERRRVVRHLCTCAECSQAWRLAWAMQAEMRDEAEETASGNDDVVVAGPWRRFAPQVAAAALLVLALGVGVLLNRSAPEPATPVHRGATVEHEIRSLVPEGEALPREDFVLRWTSAEKGGFYEVQVMNEQLETIHQVEGLLETQYRVPAEALEEVGTGEIVLWRVEGIAQDGGFPLESKTFLTTVE